MTDPDPALDKSCCTGSDISDSPAKANEVESALTEHQTAEEYDVHRNGRRHGSALPR
jgi:hypothetical protein